MQQKYPKQATFILVRQKGHIFPQKKMFEGNSYWKRRLIVIAYLEDRNSCNMSPILFQKKFLFL